MEHLRLIGSICVWIVGRTEWIPPASYLCRSPGSYSPTQEETRLSPWRQARLLLSLAALKAPSKEQTVKKAEWREPGGLFQGSFNSSLTKKESLMCRSLLFSLALGWCHFQVGSWGGGAWGEINVTQEWESKKVPPPILQLFKVLWYFFTRLTFIYLFVFCSFQCWKLTHTPQF